MSTRPTLWRAALLVALALLASPSVLAQRLTGGDARVATANVPALPQEMPAPSSAPNLLGDVLNEPFQSLPFPVGWTQLRSGSLEPTADWERSGVSPCSGANGCMDAHFTPPATVRYLVTPQLTPRADAHTLTFRAAQHYSSVTSSTLSVEISTGTATIADFTTTLLALSEPDIPVGSFGGFSVDLSAYVGMPIYIAFVHRQSNGDTILLDDAVIASPLADFSSTTAAFQNTGTLYPGQEAAVIAANVVVGGDTGTVPLNALTFTTDGTTSTPDLANARVIYTGSSPTYDLATSPAFGSPIVFPFGSLTFTGSQALTPGNNYFFLVYQARTSATPGDLIDATYESALVGGTWRTPTATTLPGAMTIIALPPDAAYASTTAAYQNPGTLYQGQETWAIVANVIVSGSAGTVPLTSITFSTAGTTNTADLASARVLYTGPSLFPDYAASPTFGSPVLNPNGTLTFTGSQALTTGNNFFFVVYRATPGATLGALADATYEGATVDGIARTPTATTLENALTIGAPPPNNDIANVRRVDSGSYTDAQFNAGADAESGEAAASCTFLGSFFDANNSLWYRYTPSTDGTVTIGASGFNTIIAVYTASSSPPSFPLTEIACQDEGNGEETISDLAVTAGTTYFIRITGWRGNGGVAATGTATVTVVGPEPVSTAPYTLNGAAGWRTLALPKADLALGGEGPGGTRLVPGYLQPIYTAGYLGADRDQRNRQDLANVFLYDEPTGSFVVPERADSVEPGQGFWVHVFDDDDSFTLGTQGTFPKTLDASGGTAVIGDHAFTLTYTPGAPLPGFNLVGNPYDEAIDWDDLSWTKTNVSATVYVWDPAYNDGDYRTWDGATGDLAGGLIPAGQGFHVEATGPSPVLVVTEAAKVGAAGTVYGLTASGGDASEQKASENIPMGLAFRLAGSVGGSPRESAAFVSLAPEAALGLDARDGRRLAGARGSNALRLYTLVPSGHDGAGAALSIASLPERLGGPVELPLHAEALAGGTPTDARATLSWDAAHLPTGWTATLRDAQSGESHDLSASGEIALVLSAADARTATDADRPLASKAGEPGEVLSPPPAPEARALRSASGEARFTLVLSPAAGGSAPEVVAFVLDAPTPNPSRGSVRLGYGLAEAGPVRLAVYDALGREVVVLADGLVSAGWHEVAVGAGLLAPGVYVVRLVGSADMASRRLTVVR